MAFVGIAGFKSTRAGKPATRSRPVVKDQIRDALQNMDSPEASAWRDFQASVEAERKEMLENNRNSILVRQQIWNDGVSEKELLTFAGQLKNVYAKKHGMKGYDVFTPTGGVATDLPGVGATGVGAMDFYTENTATLVGLKSLVPSLPKEEAAAPVAATPASELEQPSFEVVDDEEEEVEEMDALPYA
ncbi:hypothetical protein NDN08_006148 [Rhodosorus marinus]|uniref:Uncharacterized protein n=1 Tax=Rhodosorus marinus TaxID=101924 RepID=A0AAV8UP12_9RHOD|nr:hypothetical protein NDN08_006148 [Rhodosorus marinus]